jgi:uncharacterized protein YyaL (SSP411 family)
MSRLSVLFLIITLFSGTSEVTGMNTADNEKQSGRNRLASEKSPYLLQHASNPVDWYPWGDEAFERAKKEDKPVFVSIGYSACHWCHVMEEESFSDDEVAGILNKHYISVKVDREERPDIDNICMKACQAMTGGGGWPLTVVMTPDGKPFFAATYLPKTSRFGQLGLMVVLPRIAEVWTNQRDELVATGERMADFIADESIYGGGGELDSTAIESAFESFRSTFDEAKGGFGTAPKFPSPHNLTLLLRWWERSGNEDALRMVTRTLDEMRRGGIYDHLGYGFHRYSTDAQWLVPHFEKMLYDQAMLAIAYTECFQATGESRYAETVREIFQYVLSRMTDPGGGFYSAEDADSEGEEGKFYVWRPDEIKELLGEERGEVFNDYYGVTEKGHLEGNSVLHQSKTLKEAAAGAKISEEELSKQLAEDRGKLLKERNKRIPPFKDDKVLTDWNGLMIAALAAGGRTLGEASYIEAASKLADFILEHMRRPDGRLLHRYRDGEAAIPAFIDDYAFLVWGLVELYEAGFEIRYLEAALELTEEMIRLFLDAEKGGFFFTGSDGKQMLARSKEAYDGAIPSGNSVAALNLLRLGRMTGKSEYEKTASQLMKHFGELVSRAAAGFCQMLVALDFALGPSKEVVVAGDRDAIDTASLLRVLQTRFMPRKVVVLQPGGQDLGIIKKIAPYAGFMTPIDGRAAAYVCENYVCNRPVTDTAELEKLLGITPAGK